MEIKEIKQQLSILEVAAHYGLKPDRYNRLLCPFHADKTPSLQLYPKTDTFCCFSSNCSAGTGDQLQFIQLLEKCSKHEAIMKAQSMLNA
ncbi:CHC2 zinc finger domain-containing protein [Chitinophaga japonensis]|uniref:DNA primase n=1 Tax=Chitinophaga japonensis TaxID=104662 RepID=A0A562SZ64_CHIJA|nr:CHC2 zinc finger domain-containing protein [Chitinophaga japonensis]TWI86599.1 DNA primase [Chitinophaga japonensis]